MVQNVKRLPTALFYEASSSHKTKSTHQAGSDFNPHLEMEGNHIFQFHQRLTKTEASLHPKLSLFIVLPLKTLQRPSSYQSLLTSILNEQLLNSLHKHSPLHNQLCSKTITTIIIFFSKREWISDSTLLWRFLFA